MSTPKTDWVRRVRIVSDGMPHGTKVLVDGQALTNVLAIRWEIDTDNIATAHITLIDVAVDVEAADPRQQAVVQALIWLDEEAADRTPEEMAMAIIAALDAVATET